MRRLRHCIGLSRGFDDASWRHSPSSKAWGVGLDSKAVPATVLIASAEHLSDLQRRDDLREAIAFTHTDVLRALGAITRRRPDVVAIERDFATTSRGAALIERIAGDPALAACDIRVVALDSSDAAASAQPAAETAATLSASAADIVLFEAVPPVVAPLDQRGTRRAPRFKIVEGVQVHLDGRVASLVDLSVLGAEVVSRTILKPNQRVRFTLPNPARPMRCRAVVIWASFEIPKGASHYRAGLEFVDADQASVTHFIEANKQ